jgi:ankyrin repeat protein
MAMRHRAWPFVALTLCAALVHARPAVIDAAARGDLAAVRTAVAEGTAVDTRDVDGTTALHWAVRGDHAAVVALLLEAGAAADAAEGHGVTPLQLAAVNGNVDILRRLLDAGADPNEIAPSGEPVLLVAARTGVPDALALLLERGAQIDARDTNFAQTALMAAAREGHVDAARLLLEHGADVDAQTRIGPLPPFVPPCKGTGCGSEGVGINRGGLPDRGRRAAALGGMTALLYAVREGQTDVVALLLEAGANVELAEANGIRPLLLAALNNRIAAGRALLGAGADPDADDFWGRSPLWAAVEYRNLDMNNREQDSPTHNGVDRAPVLEFVRTLLEAGADPNARTREVPPPRRWLYSLNDVSWVDFTGQTPFLRAALSGDTSSMRLLLEYGADPNIATLAGTTPLMAAAGVNWVVAQTYTESMEQSLAAVALCLDLGNDINATNSMGLSALLGAVNRGANDIVRFLAEHGADLDVVDVQGRTAMRWAEGVFLAAVGAERKPATIALLESLQQEALR